jgi:RNA polymerase sigma factor (sigma-70 family)
MNSLPLPACRRPKGAPLSRAMERELATRIQSGDVNARNQLVEANLGLVVRWAVRELKKRPCNSMTLDDLIQEGRIALVRAADRFNPQAHGARFSTYATYWIRRLLFIAVANQDDLVRVPVHIHEQGHASERRLRHFAFDAGFDDPGITQDYLSDLVEKENRDRLRRAFSTLPPKERHTLLWWATEFRHGGRSKPSNESRKTRRERLARATELLEKLRWSLNKDERP